MLDPQNGQVLALASFPSYDLNEWVGGISQANYAPWRQSGAENDNAIEGLYTPGSTFKLVTATAALQTGLWPVDKYYDDTGTFKIAGCPAPGVSNDTGCVLHDDPGDSGGTFDISSALDGVERLVLLQPRAALLGRPETVRRDADPEPGHRVR